MEVVRRREEVGAVVPLVAVLQGQQVEHGLVVYPLHLKK